MLVDVYIQFIECAIHQLLRSKNIYPTFLFEQRTVYGITLWRCVHQDVVQYIDRVLRNVRPLAASDLLEQVIFSTMDGNSGTVVDQVVLQCDLLGEINEDTNMSIVGDLQEELRNALLKLAYASSESIAPIAEGCTWSIGVCIDNTGRSVEANDCLSGSLTSKEWVLDNNLLRDSSSHSTRGADSLMIKPLFSFRNDILALQVLSLAKFVA